ncbi:hypothetical protein [Streptomyces sp. NBC_01750]|uniref:hypothetical protein n=1 Tax=Streptomyces sp. NBC_01750 TaxID=2975928 RepID=UPI002DD94A51|nr:hypothetical protein [Streptomyces sp. NBC_01750]WSD30704.1 hypothetical protein OG966_01140 [Streptomyces sp. NBC_01750]
MEDSTNSQPWRAAAHLEELLMATGVLPAVDKQICSFQRWFAGHLAGIADPDHVRRRPCRRSREASPGRSSVAAGSLRSSRK